MSSVVSQLQWQAGLLELQMLSNRVVSHHILQPHRLAMEIPAPVVLYFEDSLYVSPKIRE